MTERRLYEVEVAQTVYVLAADAREARNLAEQAHGDRHCFESTVREVTSMPSEEWLGSRPYRAEGYADPVFIKRGELTVQRLIEQGFAPHLRSTP